MKMKKLVMKMNDLVNAWMKQSSNKSFYKWVDECNNELKNHLMNKSSPYVNGKINR